MKEDVVFSEKQRFNQWWIWLILLVSNFSFLIGCFLEASKADRTALVVGLLVVFAVTLLILRFRLETEIKRDGVYVRVPPLLLKWRFYPWENIAKAYIREYKPILEYGGWGIRGLGKNRALNISGNIGLQLEFTDGKKMLIGTNNWDDLQKALVKLGHKTQSPAHFS